MDIDLTISFGDILTSIIILSGIIAIILQARSVKISEKQLSLNIKDLQDISKDLHNLSDETNKIAKQIKYERDVREKMVINWMKDYSKSLDYTSHVYSQQLHDTGNIQLIINDYLLTLITILKALILGISQPNSKISVQELISSINDNLGKMAIFILLTNNWQNEIQKNSDEIDKFKEELKIQNLPDDKYFELLDKEIIRSELKFKKINEEYTKLIKNPKEEYQKSCSVLKNIILSIQQKESQNPSEKGDNT